MKQFIIISGGQNTGKTTTAWCVYQQLLPHSEEYCLYIDGNKKENHGEIEYIYDNNPCDFIGCIKISGKKVVIISRGDYANELLKDIQSLYSSADIIVICLRTMDRVGSARRIVKENYPNDYANAKQFSINCNPNLKDKTDIINSKREVAEQIVNYILEKIKNQ